MPPHVALNQLGVGAAFASVGRSETRKVADGPTEMIGELNEIRVPCASTLGDGALITLRRVRKTFILAVE